jgi:3-deoxy-D-manno-octulosonic-acid transferase
MNAEPLYETAVRLAVPALRLATPFHARVRRAVDGRTASAHTLCDFAAAHRDPTRPLLWLHAPSVGEALMAQAILAAVREKLPHVQAAFTFFSPSAERVAARVGADWHGYLPWDRRRDVRQALDLLTPSCVAFVRTEIWPVLVREASARDIPVVMLNAVLAPDSSRLGTAARSLLAPAYRRLARVGTVSAEDAANFPLLGVDRARIEVTGDARFDQVVARVDAIDRTRPLLRRFATTGDRWLVAGSTWPPDERLLIPALARRRGTLRAIVAPHEPTAAHIAALERALTHAGLRHMRLPPDGVDTSIGDDVDVVVVERVGVLADLYAVASLAWVGGGFGSAGLHSVVEPAALGIPVLFGPRHGNAGEAARLAAAGGGFIVKEPASLDDILSGLLGDEGRLRRSGAVAAGFVRAHAGGAERSARIIVQALGSG